MDQDRERNHKYVTEMSEEIHNESVGEKSTAKPVAKAGPQQTSNSALFFVSIPYHERKWIDVEPWTKILEVAKFMIGLLRRDDSVSSKIPRSGSNLCFKGFVFSALVNSNMAKLFA